MTTPAPSSARSTSVKVMVVSGLLSVLTTQIPSLTVPVQLALIIGLCLLAVVWIVASARIKAARAVAGAAALPPPPLPGEPIPADACDTCHGTGLVYVPDKHGKAAGTKPCPECHP